MGLTAPAKKELTGETYPATKRSGARFGFGFQHMALLPLLAFLILFVLYPTFELGRMAFSNLITMRGDFIWEFNGLDNARTMVHDRTFLVSLRNTIVFVTTATALQIIIGTALAILTEKARYLGGTARNVLVWPAIITPIAISVTWWLILNIEFGLLNSVLGTLDLPEQRWLASTTWALPTLIVVDVWHWTPLVFILVLAGLANLDPSLYEAARLDGASEWNALWTITLPLLTPILVVAAITRVVLGFKVFDEIYVLTSGGPGQSTEVISLYIRRVFFEQLRMGYGAFLGLTVVAVLVVALLILPMLRKRNHAPRQGAA